MRIYVGISRIGDDVLANKIATITFHRALNYGAILQCFSLQKAIQNLGYDSEVLDYDCKMISKDYKLLRLDSKVAFIKSLMLFPLYYRKKKNYDGFIKQYISMSCEYDRRELTEAAGKYAAIITGSDQVWNYKLTGNDSAYFLDFVPERRKRLSYAASFGIKEIPENKKSFYQKNLMEMGNISVREKTAASMIERLCDRKAEVVLDPVFLQTAEQWRKIMPVKKEKGYIFVYMPGIHTIENAVNLARRKGLKIIYCSYGISLRSPKKNVGDVRVSLGPDEFLSLLDGADYVVTGSFHATAFSLILQKKFFVEVPPTVGSRITDLLTTFDLCDRIFDCTESLEDRPIDWSKVEQKMERLRKQSLTSLQHSIEAAVHD